MNEGNSRSKRIFILFVILVDIIFGVTTLGIYFYIILCRNEFLDLPVDSGISARSGAYRWIVETLNSSFLVLFNCAQVIFASILFVNLIQRHPDFVESLQKSYIWLQVTKPLYILLCLKVTLILMYSFIPPKNDTNTKLTIYLPPNTNYSNSESNNISIWLRFVCKLLAIGEWVFKPMAIYSVEKFLHELYNLRLRSTHMWRSLSSAGNGEVPRQGINYLSINSSSSNLQDELKSNLFWINYKNQDIEEDYRNGNISMSSGSPRTSSQMATGSSSLHLQQKMCFENLLSFSKHFCVLSSSPAVTSTPVDVDVDVDANVPSTNPADSNVVTTTTTMSASSFVHHI